MGTNTLLTISDISKETLRLLVGNLKAAKLVNRSFDDSFGQKGRMVGDTISARLPNKFAVGTGAAVTAGDYTETVVPITLNLQRNVALSFTSKDFTLSLDDVSNRIIRPAAATLAVQVEKAVLDKIGQSTFMAVGTPGTTITDLQVFWDAGAKLADMNVPEDELNMLLSTRAYSKLANKMLSMFTPNANDKMIKGSLGEAFGFDFYKSQYVYTHTVGAYTGTPLVNGATQTGSTIALDGFGVSITGALKKGDIVTFAGVFSVNPVSGVSTGQLAQFVIEADANSNGTGQVSASIYPSIVTTGPYKTVSASPADNAAVTILGASGTSYVNSVVFHPDCAVLATATLDVPGAFPGNVSTAYDDETGIAITTELYRDGAAGNTLLRCDVLFGVSNLRRECAVRVITE